eukprot:CAMPEP_0119299216 /NCGR_PEP_ID=MMETSP1333-20130426/1328_1 /TAXON_ID=418940 /ORGANISM="Scyphosphaera apsteinii, Strain RCC1455" /LENGTH=218 /DNA_ID=CAMNT_0007300577 /DNA_START=20 /DNA_END=676 /DNA_ORIENTATION=-
MTDDANASSTGEEAAMVAALKRKLIEIYEVHHKAQKREQGLQDELAMEKREHERTTSKLSLLLRKRGTMASEESKQEVKNLYHEIETLQKMLQSERNISQQLRQRPQFQGWSYGVASASAVPAVIGARREITPEIKPMTRVSLGVPQVKRNSSVSDVAPVVAAARAVAAVAAARAVAARAVLPASVRVPVGYIPGAICIEPPKRPRSNVPAAADASSR